MIVSEGTLKSVELLRSFMDELSVQLVKSERDRVVDQDDLAHWELVWEAEDYLDEVEESNPNDEQLDFLVQDLQEALNDYAPEGFYFGALEGDGACFGFFPVPGTTA